MYEVGLQEVGPSQDLVMGQGTGGSDGDTATIHLYTWHAALIGPSFISCVLWTGAYGLLWGGGPSGPKLASSKLLAHRSCRGLGLPSVEHYALALHLAQLECMLPGTQIRRNGCWQGAPF